LVISLNTAGQQKRRIPLKKITTLPTTGSVAIAGGWLTTVVTTTRTTTWHQQHRAEPSCAADQGSERGLACFWGSISGHHTMVNIPASKIK
jgi:hypothetical protein